MSLTVTSTKDNWPRALPRGSRSDGGRRVLRKVYRAVVVEVLRRNTGVHAAPPLVLMADCSMAGTCIVTVMFCTCLQCLQCSKYLLSFIFDSPHWHQGSRACFQSCFRFHQQRRRTSAECRGAIRNSAKRCKVPEYEHDFALTKPSHFHQSNSNKTNRINPRLLSA